MWTWSAVLLAVASAVCLALALIVPRVRPNGGSHQRMVSLFVLSGVSALASLFCVGALRDVHTITARRKRRNRRRRIK
jgi:hypothetical protein